MADMINNIECVDAVKVIIISNFSYHGNESILLNFKRNGILFELCCVCEVTPLSDRKWNESVYCHHGGMHRSFWKQCRDDHISIQYDNEDMFSMNCEAMYTVGYIRVTDSDLEKLSINFYPQSVDRSTYFVENITFLLSYLPNVVASVTVGKKSGIAAVTLTAIALSTI
eukprot:15329148-Ditylum_brightwellii.AAC.1